MEAIRAIQEIIDENKEEMPTGVVTRVMDECQKAYDTQPQLYKLTWTTVDHHAHVVHCEDDEDFAQVKLVDKTQTLIVEAVDEPPRCYGGPMWHGSMPHKGMVWSKWLKQPMPYIINYPDYRELIIVHSIVPYEPRKRARDGA